MSAILQDIRYSSRSLRSSPGFSAVAVVTIALAIGANAAMFSFVDGILLNPVPYPEADRIVRVLERRPDGLNNGISTLNYLDWAEQNTVFEFMAAQTGWRATLTSDDAPVQIRAARVSARYFDIIGATPAFGRTFLPDEDQLGKDRVVLLSHRLWESRFASDPSMVGNDIVLNGEPHVVIGVLEQGSVFDRSAAQIWKPLAFEPSNMTRDFHWFSALAKLKSGVTVEQAQAEMEVIGQRIAREYPDSNKDWSVAVDGLAEALAGPELRTSVMVMFGATAFVLLIGCANLASLSLARGISREREIAVRAALGAGIWRLVRQFLTESLVLSLCGGILGIGIGYGLMIWLEALIPPFVFPAEMDIRMDSAAMLFALAVAVATGLLFGLAPAIQASQVSLVGSLKEGGHGATPGGHGQRVRNVLVVTEIALAFVLLVGAGLLMRSLSELLDVDPGFDPSNVLTVGLPITQEQFPDPVELNAYLGSIRAAVDALPGVEETAVTSALPLQGWGYGMPWQVAGREVVDLANRRGGFFKIVSASYFQALGITLIAGRPLRESDTMDALPVAVINETLAKRDFPDESPIGQRILVQEIVPGKTELGPEIAWEIVGVIADEKITGLSDEISGGMYVSNDQSPTYGISMVVRAAVDPLSLERAIRSAVDDVNKDQALSNFRTLEQIIDDSVVGNRIQSLLLGIFAGLALLLAAVGVYGVISYSVERRTHEIGTRAALGASAGSLQRLLFRGGMGLTLIGLAIGLIGSLVATRVMASMLYGVGVHDPVTMIVVGVVLAAVAAVACFIPARRVTKIDPMEALRCQ